MRDYDQGGNIFLPRSVSVKHTRFLFFFFLFSSRGDEPNYSKQLMPISNREEFCFFVFLFFREAAVTEQNFLLYDGILFVVFVLLVKNFLFLANPQLDLKSFGI